MKLLPKEQQESYENAKICYICKKKLKINMPKIKKYCHDCHYAWEYRGVRHSICNLKYSVPKKVL